MDDIRKDNKFFIESNKACMSTIRKIHVIEEFIDDLIYLFSGRDTVFVGSKFFDLDNILISAELTIGNCIECCKFGCFADANMLLRKYRDDLFFILYSLVYKNNIEHADRSKVEENLNKWLKNELSDLSISSIMLMISKAPNLKDTIEKYSLKSTFKIIGKRLNDFVHSNGYDFYNSPICKYGLTDLQSILGKIAEDAEYITTSFVFLLFLCCPYMISSTYYIDSLELEIEPVYDSQYWVAPFVEDFLKKNINLIDSNGIEYLKEKTPMIFKDF